MKTYHFSFILNNKLRDFSCQASSLKVALKRFFKCFPFSKLESYYSIETNGLITHRKLNSLRGN